MFVEGRKEGWRDLMPTSPLGQAMVRGVGERPRSCWGQPEARGQLQDCVWRPVRVPAAGLMGGHSCGWEGTAVGGRAQLWVGGEPGRMCSVSGDGAAGWGCI